MKFKTLKGARTGISITKETPTDKASWPAYSPKPCIQDVRMYTSDFHGD